VFITPASFIVTASATDSNGVISQVEFYLGTNSLGVVTNSSPNYSVTVSNLVTGNYTLLALATDACGNQATSAPVVITVRDYPPLTVVTNIFLNRQSGYYEEVVRICNPTPYSFNTVGVLVFGVTSPRIVHNATAFVNGIPYVQNGTIVAPGDCVDIRIQIYVPLNVTSVDPLQVVPIIMPATTASAVVGTPAKITRAQFLADHTFLLNFNTIAGANYFILFSEDLITWTTSAQPVTGNGFAGQWIDYGPPATTSLPNKRTNRFYRVVSVP